MAENNITAEEYAAAIEWINFIVGNSGVRTPNPGNQLVARVLLALDGAWREVPEKFWGEDRDYLGAQRMQSKAAIAARHGLPVEGDHFVDANKKVEPCPECGGCREIPNRQYCLVDRCTVTTCPDHYGHCPVSKPCPACQGGR